MKISKKQLILLGLLNILLIVLISFLVNYAYSKLYWQDRVSIRPGEDITDQDTIVEAYVGQSYKIGTAFEVYKKTDPLLKVVSKKHGALELAVASGDEHFSDLARPRDAVIRKTGEGNLILSIPSCTHKNTRSIIIGNESKTFMEFKNSDKLLINTDNFRLDSSGKLTVRDIILGFQDAKNIKQQNISYQDLMDGIDAGNNSLLQNKNLTIYLQNLNYALLTAYQKINLLKNEIQNLKYQ